MIQENTNVESPLGKKRKMAKKPLKKLPPHLLQQIKEMNPYSPSKKTKKEEKIEQLDRIKLFEEVKRFSVLNYYGLTVLNHSETYCRRDLMSEIRNSRKLKLRKVETKNIQALLSDIRNFKAEHKLKPRKKLLKEIRDFNFFDLEFAFTTIHSILPRLFLLGEIKNPKSRQNLRKTKTIGENETIYRVKLLKELKAFKRGIFLFRYYWIKKN